MKRGEVWWANLAASWGRRPVVLLSRDSAYQVRESVTVAPITTRIRRIPVEVELGPEDVMPRVCVANLDNISTIDKNLLQERITSLSPAKLRAVEEAICFALGMER